MDGPIVIPMWAMFVAGVLASLIWLALRFNLLLFAVGTAVMVAFPVWLLWLGAWWSALAFLIGSLGVMALQPAVADALKNDAGQR